MQDVIGGRGDPNRFDAFLNDWRTILLQRVDDAVTGIASIDGVRGLILAGGIGRGAPWPLSDIDLLPIYDAGRREAAEAAIEQHRSRLLTRWIDEGWWTGIDIGRLAFTTTEVASVLTDGNANLPALLTDDRWYHSLDKGYGGRAVHDPDSLAAPLADWLTTRRFTATIVQLRLDRARTELHAAQQCWDMSLVRRDTYQATLALQAVVTWLRALLLETWGERDASLARIGTRFDRLAAERGLGDLAAAANTLLDLDDASVSRRMAIAPAWVHERHDRSLRARRLTGEAVSPTEDARDVLRVCSQYALRSSSMPPFANWLAVPESSEELGHKTTHLTALIERGLDAARAAEGPRPFSNQ